MPDNDFFERLMPRFALQAGAAKKNADRQADAERLIAGAEYECSQMRRELMAAFGCRCRTAPSMSPPPTRKPPRRHSAIAREARGRGGMNLTMPRMCTD